jgi:phospholipid N-methyltransferase
MAKLVNLIPGREVVKEDLEDMDVTLPSQVQRFLDRTISIVKGYNLPKKKEQLIIAKIIDALGMDRQQLMQAITKIKKNDILKK